ncbi:MAG: DUF4007 family protein [Firmicutes bacterium]|nr:DUF4007 family protein [Bacillota bacterium]
MSMRFRAHETFFIRKGWLSKGMRCVANKPDLFIDRDENPMDVLGIGANMVKSLRYWLQAVGLTSEPNKGKRTQHFTDLGRLIYEYDTYIEELGTLYLLQYYLASQKEDATAWYFFFNEFSMTEFSREDFVDSLQKYIKMEDGETDYAIRSLNDDFQCIINTYLPRYKSNPTRVSPENNIDCPFGELGLVDILNKKKKTYKKSIPAADTFNPYVVLAVIVANADNRKEIMLNELLSAPCNIGKVFNLDSVTMLDVLYRIEKIGLIKINRTAGLDVISLQEELSFLDCVKRFYESINEQSQESLR